MLTELVNYRLGLVEIEEFGCDDEELNE